MIRLAFYGLGSCGGCEIAVLEIGDRLLDLAERVEIDFWPSILDHKLRDIEGSPDGHIDACFINGVVRLAEHREVAQLLRRKSKRVLAYGSCANEGSVPALANLASATEIFDRCYLDCPSNENPAGVVPLPQTTVNGCDLSLPAMLPLAQTLDQVIEVDYIVPGCPPTVETTWAAIEALDHLEALPRGSVLGAGNKSVCDECRLTRHETRITAFHRPHLMRLPPDNDRCLLELGLVCAGPATRSGCGARCLSVSMACRGCYGPAGVASDQGSHVLAALASMVEGATPEAVTRVVDQIVDPAGTLYRYGMGRSTLFCKGGH